ncbi:MAG: hypothetical protein QN183_01310 [Armatimonadota bacterium]|nr:hypothetical protein [Armatimonadota bacterium]MDR7534989.1 hypothetical protein [Armatimonadota bacterium]
MVIFKLPLLIAAAIATVLSLTRYSLRTLRVPEEQELVAGIFLILVYGLLGLPVLGLLAR